MTSIDRSDIEAKLSQFFIDIRQQLTQWRREFHQHPEVGWTEYRTTYRIGKELESLGFTLSIGKEALESTARMGVPDHQQLKLCEEQAKQEGVSEEWIERMEGGHTGLVASWDTGREGPHVAFRIDIDALPITESTLESHHPTASGFRSRQAGTMHACAHDGHVTIGLGVATWIAQFQDQLNGRFTLLFQPAEEGIRGAKAMVEKGWLDHVDYFLSGHIGIQSLEIGDIVATTSGFLSTTKMNVTYTGASAHAGGAPHEGKNALLAAAAAALHLHAIPRHSAGVTRVNVGKIAAGSGRNIIADQGKIELETRGETTELNQYMVKEAKRIILSVAQLYDVQANIEIVGEGIGGACDEEWISMVQEACASSQKIKRIIPHLEMGGSEDVTYMLNRVQQHGGKATYMVFGTPLSHGHHHPQFDYEEEVLEIAVEALVRTVGTINDVWNKSCWIANALE
jgi:aminobenzoyl-glutamate utilization protein A